VKVTGTGTGTFSDKNAGAGKTVTISGFTFTGADAANYSFSAPTTIATISQKPLTISGIEGVNKVYDGTTIATLNTDAVSKAGLVPGDIINVSATGVFASKEVGNGKTINLTTANTGLDVGNYSITVQATATANITPATLTVKASDSAKFITESDPSGFNGAIYLGLKGADTKDVLTGTLSIVRSNPTVNAKGDYVLTPSGYGTVNGNYEIIYQTGKFTIVPADTLLVAVNNKTINYADPLSYTLTAKYLRSDNSTIVTLSNVTITNNSVVANDGIGGSASFDIVAPTATKSGSGNINAGAYALTAENTVITGSNFNNPIVVTGTLTVSPKVIPTSDLIISVAKVYDGNTNITRSNATVTPSSSVIITGDNVNVYAVGSFTDGNVGANKKITLNAFLIGDESANYALQDNGITKNVGQISQLASVSYTGASGGSWSNPSNWNNGAIPINGNVAQVVIPTGVTVVYDYESLSGNIVSNINGVDTNVSKLPTSTIVNNGGTLNIYVNLNITFSNNVSGTGSVSLSGTGAVTINTANTYSGGTNINASKLIIGNVNAIGSGAITSSNGTLQVASGIILDSITVNGPVKLASDINTTGAQTYNGGVILDAGYAVGDVATPMTISTVNGDITFGGTLAAGNDALLTKQSLTLNAGGLTSKITFNDTVGSLLTTNGNTYADYLANPGTASIYNLNVTGAQIVINANITTFATQEYHGAVSIGDNKTNGTVRTIVAEYTDSPKITFFGTVDDSTANTHDLIIKAVSLSGKGSEVTFEGAIGSIVPLKTLTVALGLQNSDTSSKYSDIKPNEYLDGVIIKGDITTYGDQNYAQKTELEIKTTLKCLNAGCSVNFFKNSSPGGKDREKYEPKGYEPVPPKIPEVITAAYETADLQRFSSKVATEMGDRSDNKVSTGGSISVVFCGAEDDLMNQLKQRCEDI
jgi:autotransporter-associated beta strand protein